MDLNNKGKHYVKLYRDTKSSNIYALSAEVESHEEVDVDVENLLNSPGTEFVLEKNLENDVVPDEQANNELIPEINNHLVADAESEVNDEENHIESEQEITKKGFKWRKRPKTNQKQPSDLETEITHPFPKHHTSFDIISADSKQLYFSKNNSGAK